MAKRNTQNQTDKPKKRGCLSNLLGAAIILCFGSYVIGTLFPSSSTEQRNATRTAQARTASEQRRPTQQAATATLLVPVFMTNAAVKTEQAIENFQGTAVALTDIAEAVTPVRSTPTLVPTVTMIEAGSNLGTRVVARATADAQAANDDATDVARYNARVLTQTAAPTPTFTPSSTSIPGPTLNATRRAESYAQAQTRVAATQAVAALPTQAQAEYWYAASNVNARSCAATNCEVVTVISRGTRIEVIGQEQGQTVSGNTLWLITQVDGRTAYIHRSTVLSSPPPAENAPAPTSVPAQPSQPPTQAPQAPPTATPLLQSEPALPPVIQPPPASACNCHGGDTLNCSNFSSQSAAQACHNQCMAEVGRDVHGLDGNDNDGRACESLP